MSSHTPLSAAILCGGSGRRLGGIDKSQLAVDGRTFLDRQLDVLHTVASDIMLVGRILPPATNDVRLVQDLMPNTGALGGVYTALCEATFECVLVVACDMPFLTSAFLQHLEHLASADPTIDAVVPVDAQGRHPLCGAYRRRSVRTLEAQLEAGQLRVDTALAALRVREVTGEELARFDVDGRLLANVNTREDYQAVAAGQWQENIPT